ncbi:MAG: glycosyltransferase N-terminal domain-containing protein, partial [Alphaproteobacteria bacterium]
MILLLYRLVQLVLSPLLLLMIGYRVLVGREDKSRFAERMGNSSIPRPEGQLVWLHGASVGEVNSLIPILHHLRHARPAANLLLTTGTRTGMRTLEKVAGTLEGHGQILIQYVPLDICFAVSNFFTHWKPTLSVFIESEFWPELLAAAPSPMLLNGKISDRSWPRYQTWGWFFRGLVSRYTLIIAQRDDDAKRLRHLGATNITVGGNLKFDAPPLPVDDTQLEKFRSLIGSRPTVVVASTHPGEEEEAAQLHLAIKASVPDVLTILVPRHPHRGTAASNEVQRHTRNIHRRGIGEVP